MYRGLKAQKEAIPSSFKHRLTVNTQNFINRKRFAVERNIDEVSDFFQKANRRVKKFLDIDYISPIKALLYPLEIYFYWVG